MATLQQQEAQDQVTTGEEAAQGNAARQTQMELSSKQSEITGQLAAAVAQQQALQAAAAARAVRAAQRPHAAAVASSAGQQDHDSVAFCPGPRSPGGCHGPEWRRPFASALPAMRSQGRVRRQLRRRLAGGRLYGWLSVQPTDLERGGSAGGHAPTDQCPAERATPAEQDDLAIALYQADGEQPWDDSCRNS